MRLFPLGCGGPIEAQASLQCLLQLPGQLDHILVDPSLHWSSEKREREESVEIVRVSLALACYLAVSRVRIVKLHGF